MYIYYVNNYVNNYVNRSFFTNFYSHTCCFSSIFAFFAFRTFRTAILPFAKSCVLRRVIPPHAFLALLTAFCRRMIRKYPFMFWKRNRRQWLILRGFWEAMRDGSRRPPFLLFEQDIFAGVFGGMSRAEDRPVWLVPASGRRADTLILPFPERPRLA